MTCFRWILGSMKLEIWCKIGLSGDWCLCTALRSHSGACYCWIGWTEWHHELFEFVVISCSQLALCVICWLCRELAEKFPTTETYILLGDAYMSIQEVGIWPFSHLIYLFIWIPSSHKTERLYSSYVRSSMLHGCCMACKERKCGGSSASRDETGQVDVWR